MGKFLRMGCAIQLRNTLISPPGPLRIVASTDFQHTMVFSGDVTIPATCLRVDRRTFLSSFSESDRILKTVPTEPTMGFSVNTTHLLGDKPAKRKAFQRKKRGNEVLATSPQATSVCPAPVSPKAKHMDLLEAVSQREMDSQPFVSDSAGSLNPGSGYGLERSNAGGEEKSPGLGSDQSYREIAYNEYLTQKFGLDDAGPDRNIAALKNRVGSDALAAQQPEVSTVSMEMPFRFSMRDRRPKIQLTIPRTRSQHYVVIPQDGVKEKISNQNHDTPKSVSPPSSTSHSRTDSGGPLVRLSIISPMSEVQMPTPRRPFSTFSFEDMSLDMPSSTLLLSKSASSDSSDDTGENDDRSSNYSPRSSVSSLTSDPGATKPISVKRPSLAFSVISPTAAGVFDPMPHLSAFPKPPRGLKSSISMIEWADRNKPLPPEPSPDIKPLNYSLHPFSRTNSMKTRRKTPTPLCVSRQSTIHIALQKTSLRSKYTPADLDALDDAFERTSPLNRQPTLYANPNSPTLSQAELELEAQLCIIGEEVPLEKEVVHLVHDPLQISRGPMHMEPSRKAPSPPQSQSSYDVSLGSRKKIKKKPSTHVVMQMRPGQEKDGLSRSPIAVPARSNSKAHRVLGRSRTGTPMEADTSAESCWDTSESLQSSPNISMGDSDTPASEVSPIIPDTTFEEVRQRLELLSPKDDASQVFLEFHERYLSGTPSTPSPIREQGSSQPQLDFSLSSMTSSENAESSHIDQPLVTLNSVQSINNLSIEIIPTPTLDDVHLQNHGRVNEPSTRSLGSITASEIPEIYASLPSPKSTIRPASTELASTESLLTVEEAERMISADAAEKVLLRILENLDNLQDLFAAATVSRGFYRIFKRHELSLMKNALHSMSPAAWELREMAQSCPGFEDASKKSPKLGYTPTLYLQHYMRDMYTMIALKSMILVHCESFLRADTITALAGGETERASQIDDAFWRVWTFCRLFGCGTNRQDDIVGQMDWLNGGVLAKQQRRNTNTVDMGTDVGINSITTDTPAFFGQGNYGGLTAEDLYDMTEIWTCLGVLVRGFQGKRQLARDFGVFANSNITVGDVEKEDAELGKR